MRRRRRVHRGAGADVRVVISGASGMIGRALSRRLAALGHEVVGITRGRRPGWITWEPRGGALDPRALEGAGAIVHLAGKSLAGGRWSAGAKREMWSSRVDTGTRLAEAVAGMDRPPRVYVTASAVGYYGSRGDHVLVESAARGDGFLADLCEAWEGASAPAAAAGIRTVAVRAGVVLESLTSRLRLPFSLGLGARLGRGDQWLAWIGLDDVARLYTHAILSDTLRGAVNGTAPASVTNTGFTRALADAVGRPAFLAVPAWALRLMLGREMADQTLLASQRVVPARAQADGFACETPSLEAALERALGRGHG